MLCRGREDMNKNKLLNSHYNYGLISTAIHLRERARTNTVSTHFTRWYKNQAGISLPSCSVSKRSTLARTEGRWETTRQVRSPFLSISLVKTRPSRRASILLVGSSRSMKGAELKKARASATRCRCPSDRSEPLSASR